MPSFLKLNFVELREVRRAMQPIRRPGFDLLGFAHWACVLRNNLNRKVIQSADLARMRVDLEDYVHLSEFIGHQHLLADKPGQLVVGFIILHHRQIGFKNGQ